MYRALIVDDIEAIRYSIAGQVDDSPVSVVSAGTAENGEKALEWLNTYYADICITDIRMPVIDGLELIKKIREKYYWMFSLVISGYDDFNYARSSIQLEAVDYILKPVDEDNLERALGKAVAKIEEARLSKAASLMFSCMSECSRLLDNWVEQIKIMTTDLKDTIDETIVKLCKIAGSDYFLMDFLAEEWINKVCREIKIPRPKLEIKHCKKNIYISKPVGHSDIRKYFADGCRQKLINAIDMIKRGFEESKGNQQSRMIDNIMKYIHQNYMRSDLTLQEIADNVMFSKNHIANVFKQEEGITIWNYIIGLRMKKAKELLAESTVKTLEVAMNVGYNNYNHFSQLFKEYCGISAQEYRKKIQGK